MLAKTIEFVKMFRNVFQEKYLNIKNALTHMNAYIKEKPTQPLTQHQLEICCVAKKKTKTQMILEYGH